MSSLTTHNHRAIPYEDRKLFKELDLDKYNACVAGGAALRWYNNQSVAYVSDIDVWCTNSSDVQRINEHYQSKFDKVAFTKNANTYQTYVNGLYTIQVISHTYSTIDELLNSFDLSVCQIATQGSNFIYKEHFEQDVKQRVQRVVKYHPTILRRVLKYSMYGYALNDADMLSILENPDTKYNYNDSAYNEYEDGFSS